MGLLHQEQAPFSTARGRREDRREVKTGSRFDVLVSPLPTLTMYHFGVCSRESCRCWRETEQGQGGSPFSGATTRLSIPRIIFVKTIPRCAIESLLPGMIWCLHSCSMSRGDSQLRKCTVLEKWRQRTIEQTRGHISKIHKPTDLAGVNPDGKRFGADTLTSKQ